MQLTASAMPPRLLPFAASAALHAAFLLGAGALVVAPGPAAERTLRSVLYVSLPVQAPQPPAVARLPSAAVAKAPERVPVAAAPAMPRASSTPRAVAPTMPVLAGELPAPSVPPASVVAASESPAPAPSSSAPGTPVAAAETDGAMTAVAARPSYLHTPQPQYPQAAREDEQEGLVVLLVLVSREGRPARIRVANSSGFRLLDAAAVAGVGGWTFVPARDGSLPVEAWMEVPVRFQLR